MYYTLIGGDMYAKLKDQKGISLKERQLVEWFQT